MMESKQEDEQTGGSTLGSRERMRMGAIQYGCQPKDTGDWEDGRRSSSIHAIPEHSMFYNYPAGGQPNNDWGLQHSYLPPTGQQQPEINKLITYRKVIQVGIDIDKVDDIAPKQHHRPINFADGSQTASDMEKQRQQQQDKNRVPRLERMLDMSLQHSSRMLPDARLKAEQQASRQRDGSLGMCWGHPDREGGHHKQQRLPLRRPTSIQHRIGWFAKDR